MPVQRRKARRRVRGVGVPEALGDFVEGEGLRPKETNRCLSALLGEHVRIRHAGQVARRRFSVRAEKRSSIAISSSDRKPAPSRATRSRTRASTSPSPSSSSDRSHSEYAILRDTGSDIVSGRSRSTCFEDQPGRRRGRKITHDAAEIR